MPFDRRLLPLSFACAAALFAAGCAGSEARDPGAPPEAAPASAGRSAAGGTIAGGIAYDAGPAPASYNFV